jgi:hypothetical protein
MQLYGPGGKPIPPKQQTGWKRFCLCLSKVWSRMPLRVKLPVVIGLFAGICTIFVHGHTIWRWIVPAEPTVQQVKVINSEPAKPDFIPGTQITHAQLRHMFPFGYVLISFRDGKEGFDPRLEEDQLKIDVDWNQIQITPDFEKRTVLWDVKNMHVYKPRTSMEIGSLNIRQTFPMKVGVPYEYPASFGRKPSPHIYFATVNDNQVTPVFVMGFRIPQKPDSK